MIDTNTPPKRGEDQVAADERQAGSALAKGLAVLSCFGGADGFLSNQVIAERCSLPRATVTRITAGLAHLGYLTENNDHGNRRFRLGMKTIALGTAGLAQLDIRQLLKPLLQQLANASGTTVSLGTRDGIAMLYVEVCRSANAVSLTHHVGTRVPILTTAMGRAYLAGAAQSELAEMYQQSRELDEGIYLQMRREQALARDEFLKHGCNTSFGDWHPDVNAVALPLRDPSTEMTFVVNCGGAKSRASEQYLLQEVRPKLAQLIAGFELPANALGTT